MPWGPWNQRTPAPAPEGTSLSVVPREGGDQECSEIVFQQPRIVTRVASDNAFPWLDRPLLENPSCSDVTSDNEQLVV